MTFNKYIQDETILKTLEALGYELMLPVQNQVIPVLKQKKDCIIQSKTGSGKTLSFVLPLIDSFEVERNLYRQLYWLLHENWLYRSKKNLIEWVV